VAAERLAFFFVDDYLETDGFSQEKIGERLDFCSFLIQKTDPVLYNFLKINDVSNAYPLRWIISWFSYDCLILEDTMLIYDYILETTFLTPLYLSASRHHHEMHIDTGHSDVPHPDASL